MIRRQRIVLAIRRRKRQRLILDEMRRQARAAMDAFGKSFLQQVEDAFWIRV